MPDNTIKQSSRGRATDDAVEELNFDTDDSGGRIGDARTPEQTREAFTPERVREAGMTGGEMGGDAITDDDMSPATLLDEDGSGSDYGLEDSLDEPQDRSLSIVEAEAIGGGDGLDEAELARAKYPDKPRRKLRKP